MRCHLSDCRFDEHCLDGVSHNSQHNHPFTNIPLDARGAVLWSVHRVTQELLPVNLTRVDMAWRKGNRAIMSTYAKHHEFISNLLFTICFGHFLGYRFFFLDLDFYIIKHTGLVVYRPVTGLGGSVFYRQCILISFCI
jgi:hypothetical protein